MVMLKILNITKDFGGLRALNRVDLEVYAGEIVGLIGPNGAGKTTLFNIITGVQRPNSGSVLFKGEDITNTKPHVVAAKGIIRTFQATIVFSDFSVMQNILMGFHLKVGSGVLQNLISSFRSRKREDPIIHDASEIIEYLGLDLIRNEVVRNLPHGYQKLVGIAVALAANPKLLLLDEPVAGMNAVETMKTMDHIRNIVKEKKISVVLVEHDMKAVMNVCERIIVLNFGRKIAEGPPNMIVKNRQVIEAYLGMDSVTTE